MSSPFLDDVRVVASICPSAAIRHAAELIQECCENAIRELRGVAVGDVRGGDDPVTGAGW
jgi:hypothetical protein